ncbi:virulence factor SrfC family protein [Alcaligenes pakistanensis]|nr:virulence factor SrfC family protein [Alcaligenes pakistanensis]
MTTLQQHLCQDWQNVYQGAGEAIDWVTQARGSSQRLNAQADSLVLELRRARNTARSLGVVSGRPMTIGFFGLSQAGKSYLISSLAAGNNGRLETNYGGQTIDFLRHVNPPGGGKEATGLVTRFSRNATAGPDAYPVELQIFSEVDMVKILVNSYFNDFDKEQVGYVFSSERIKALIDSLKGRAGAADKGLSADDAVSLWDYVRSSFGNTTRLLDSTYWPEVINLAPSLRLEDRAQLFSILWGEQAELSELYIGLAKVLQALGHPSKVYAPLTALIRREGDAFVQQDSIMNVDVLESLGSPTEKSLSVLPVREQDGQYLAAAQAVEVPLAHLAALTVELTFPLMGETQAGGVDKVDLLDFPGYRGRLNIRSVQDAGAASESSGGNPASQLILRGKVAYLFERYTDQQEMNGLVMCTASDKQSDVKDVEPVLTRWVHRTQGATPQERENRKVGLMWAITMFDKRIGASLIQDDAQVRDSWDGLMKMSFKERFGHCEWLQQWKPDSPFSNTFLVRKPGMPTPFIDLNTESQELSITASVAEKMDRMRGSFIENPLLAQQLSDPAQAWDAMLALNDGGMQRLRAYVAQIGGLDFKLMRLQEQFRSLHETLVKKSLHSWYSQDGDQQSVVKEALAKLFREQLPAYRAIVGELLAALHVPQDTLRELFLSLGSSKSEPDEPGVLTQEQPFEQQYADLVYRTWLSQLRELPASRINQNVLRMPVDLLSSVVEELIVASDRWDLQGKLLAVLTKRRQSGVRRERLADRQVCNVAMTISEFVTWFYLKGDKASQDFFTTPKAFGQDGMPALPAEPQDHGLSFFEQWIAALAHTTLHNAGYEGGRELSLEQNQALGRILERFTNKSVA